MVSISALPKYYDYFKRGLKVYPSAVFGPKGQDILTKAYTEAFTAPNAVKYNIFDKQWWSQLKQGTKNAGLASEKYAATFAKNGFWKSTLASAKGIPTTIAAGWRAGGIKAAAEGAGTVGKYFGKFKGAMAGVGKKMPIIGSILLVACELPNIFRATKNEGIGSGVVETGKAAARIGGATVGASIGSAIGTAICPGIGTAIGGIIGWMAGEWAVKKVVGKSYSEKQEEQQEKIQQAVAQQQQVQAQAQPQTQGLAQNPAVTNMFPTTANQAQLAQLQQMLYANNALNDDFMYQTIRPKFNVQA